MSQSPDSCHSLMISDSSKAIVFLHQTTYHQATTEKTYPIKQLAKKKKKRMVSLRHNYISMILTKNVAANHVWPTCFLHHQ